MRNSFAVNHLAAVSRSNHLVVYIYSMEELLAGSKKQRNEARWLSCKSSLEWLDLERMDIHTYRQTDRQRSKKRNKQTSLKIERHQPADEFVSNVKDLSARGERTSLSLSSSAKELKNAKTRVWVSGWCQDGHTSSRMITEVKHLKLNQFSVGWCLVGSGACCCGVIKAAQGHGKYGPWVWPQNPS